ncbi:DUF7144 family membrane protein [Actinoplanes sp. CA-142083]|uniref:DUF7144 family membrane protein n=1 Tax=Actinoplanes sp. CA-142083 TaxID=3239903 RepID=UPI003D91E420
MSTQSSYATERPGRPGSAPGMTGWVGILAFAGIMMVLLGLFHVIEGIVSLADDSFYKERAAELALGISYTAWGWIHVVVGVIAVAAGTGIFLGMMWARVTGVLICVVSAFSSMLFLPAYPVWSTILIAVDVLVIYALVVHGREVRG